MCGIFGIINKKVSKFDLSAFCTLGVNNDSRGGDSCGIFIDGFYEYGVDKLKLFKDFMFESKLLKSIGKCSIALGHCRKASVGKINEENAQPIIIKNDNKIEYVLIHNGTIVNYKELAAKYIPNIDITNMTDSKVMAYIFYNCGYDVLSEYIGAGVFVMVDYRDKNPKILLFKGESKLYKYNKNTSVERPLYCNYNKNEFLFSSISEYLSALRPLRTTYTLASNTLVSLEKGELYEVKKYSRDNCYQIESQFTTSKATKYYNNYWNTYITNQNNIEDSNEYDNFLDYNWDYIEFNSFLRKYTLHNNIVHGEYNVNIYGLNYKLSNETTRKVAFWEGVLLKDVEDFKVLQSYCKTKKISPHRLLKRFPDLVYSKSVNLCWQNKEGKWVQSITENSNDVFTGIELIPFTCTKNIYVNGELKVTQIVTYKDTVKALNSEYENEESDK